MRKNKKPFSDKRWTQPLGGVVVGYREVTEEEKQQVELFRKKLYEQRKQMKNDKNNGKK